MTAAGWPRHEGRNWTTGVVYWDEPSDPANPGPLPISTLRKHATMQTRLMRIGIDIDNVEMVTTDDVGRIPAQYQEFVEVFSKKKAETLPLHRQIDHAIDLEPNYKLPYSRIYNLSEFELKTLKTYIETNLANSFIQRSSSSAAVSIQFEKKKDGGLRLCVDYRALNLSTVKNRYPLPLISELLDRVREARILTKLDLRNAYHLIRVKEGNEFKTAFRTRCGQFKYRVMPFGLTNAPATFQDYIDDCLRPYIDDFTVCYLDDILICSANEQEHEDHVRKVLQYIQEFRLYCKAEKCQFGVRDVSFLGFVINSDGIAMESDRISTIEDCPTPESVRNVQVLLGFTNFYRKFIRKYGKVTAPISKLAKDTEVGMDSGCRTRISKAQKGLYRSTDPPAFQPVDVNE